MVDPHLLQVSPRPELSDRLLAAVAERDERLSNRLLQQWVHRRGLSSLEAWILGPLLSSQGPCASDWLRHCLELSGLEPIAGIEEPLPIVLDSEREPLPDSPASPAPAPPSLAQLRSWLPDRSDDLPSAC